MAVRTFANTIIEALAVGAVAGVLHASGATDILGRALFTVTGVPPFILSAASTGGIVAGSHLIVTLMLNIG